MIEGNSNPDNINITKQWNLTSILRDNFPIRDEGGVSDGAHSIAIADFNNDGKKDLAIGWGEYDAKVGSSMKPNSGATLLFYGTPSGLNNNPDIIFNYTGQYKEGAFFGSYVAGCELTGDSYDDLVICAHEGHFQGSRNGTCWVWEGSSSQIDPNSPLYEIKNPGATTEQYITRRFGGSGACSSQKGLVIGANNRVYYYKKAPFDTIPDTNWTTNTSAVRNPPVLFDDFNNDGEDDLAFGDEQQGNGQIRIYYGNSAGINKGDNSTIEYILEDINLGYSIASGDLDNNDYSDIASFAVTAPNIYSQPFPGYNYPLSLYYFLFGTGDRIMYGNYPIVFPKGTKEGEAGFYTYFDSICRYSNTDEDYSTMTNFETTGGRKHNASFTGLEDGRFYSKYVRCNNTEHGGKVSTYSHNLSFVVANYAYNYSIHNSVQKACYNITSLASLGGNWGNEAGGCTEISLENYSNLAISDNNYFTTQAKIGVPPNYVAQIFSFNVSKSTAIMKILWEGNATPTPYSILRVKNWVTGGWESKAALPSSEKAINLVITNTSDYISNEGEVKIIARLLCAPSRGKESPRLLYTGCRINTDFVDVQAFVPEEIISKDTPPSWNNPQTNLTTDNRINDHRWFYVNWLDDIGLSHYIFSWNGTNGSWINDSAIEMTGLINQSNVTKIINLTRGNTIGWMFCANDTSNNMVCTDIWTFVVNNTPPSFNESLTNQLVVTPNSLYYDINCSDADGDSITYYDNTTLFDIDSITGLIQDTPLEAENGTYTINITCGDGMYNTSQPFDYTILDGTPPGFKDAVNGSSNFRRYENFTANITIIDGLGLAYAIFSTNASGIWWNSSDIPITGTEYRFNNSANISLTKGNYICWKVYANDTSANQNVSNEYCFNVGNSPPTFNESLTNQLVITPNSLYYDINCSDADGDSITYYDNTTLFDIDSITGLIQDTPLEAENGTYTINITCGDGMYNTSQPFDYTILDGTPPGFKDAVNGSSNFRRYENFTANITIIDGLGLAYAIFSTNASGIWWNSSDIPITGTEYRFNNSANISLTKGNYICWKVYANDTSANQNVSNEYCFNVGNSPPTIPIVYFPKDGESYLDIPYINYSSIDIDGDQIIYQLYINGTLNITTTVNVTDWNASDGLYNLTVTANDGTDSSDNSSAIIFRLDATEPSIAFVDPTTNSGTINQNYILANVSALDDGSGLDTITLYLYNSIDSEIRTSTITPLFTAFTNLADGTYYLNATATDKAGNIAKTETRIITISTTVIPPPGGGGGAGGGEGAEEARLISDFEVSPDLVKVSILQGETKTDAITIRNTGETKLFLTLTNNINQLLFVPEDKFELDVNEEKTVQLIFTASSDERPDVYTGRLEVSDGIKSRVVAIVVEVNERKEALFDVKVVIPDEFRNIKAGNRVEADIIIHNLGTLMPVDVSLYYSIRDMDGKDILPKHETFAVQEQKLLHIVLDTPPELEEGYYLIYARTDYRNQTATSSDVFRVTLITEQLVPPEMDYLWLLIIIIILLIILIFAKRRKKEEESRKEGYTKRKPVRKWLFGLFMRRIERELAEHTKRGRLAGFNDEKIKNILIKRGYKLKDIERALEKTEYTIEKKGLQIKKEGHIKRRGVKDLLKNILFKKKVDKELMEHIKRGRLIGFKEAQIKDILTKRGYKPEDVDEAFKHVKNNPP